MSVSSAQLIEQNFFILRKNVSIRFPNDGIISIKELNNLRRVAIDELEKEMLDMSFRKMNDLEQFNCLSKKREDHKKNSNSSI